MIQITQGDDVTIELTILNGEGDAVDLTGASFTTYLKKADGTTLTVANSDHTANANQVTNKGKFTFVLSAATTALLKAGVGLNIVTKVVQSSVATHYHGTRLLTVLSPDV